MRIHLESNGVLWRRCVENVAAVVCEIQTDFEGELEIFGDVQPLDMTASGELIASFARPSDREVCSERHPLIIDGDQRLDEKSKL